MKTLKYLFLIIINISLFLKSTAQIKELAPDFKVIDVYGNVHILEDYLNEGKYVFVQFFSVGCGSCQDEAPIINEVYKDFGCNCTDIVFIGIDHNATNEDVLLFKQLFGMDFISISGKNGNGFQVFDMYNVTYTPYSFLIAPSQEIVAKNPVFTTSQDLKDIILSYEINESSCKGTDFLYFALEKENNTQFENDIISEINGNEINFYFDINSSYDYSTLIPTFVSSTLSNVYINDLIQISDTSFVDLSSLSLQYNIIAEDNLLSKQWNVNINLVEKISEFTEIFEIYPNPTKDRIYFKTKSNINQLSIYDNNGNKLINNKNINENYIDISEFNSGIYFIQLQIENKKITRRFIIDN